MFYGVLFFFFFVPVDHLDIVEMTNYIPSSDDAHLIGFFFFFFLMIAWFLDCSSLFLILLSGKCPCLMSMFEGQEDKSETSQEAAPSDEEKGTDSQVLHQHQSDHMSDGLVAADWAISFSYS